MSMPSITAGSLVLLAGAALAFQLILLRRSRHTVFNGGILLCLGLLIAAALPLVPWAELAEEALDQAVAALHALEVAYVILTL
ncbi:putative membrane protein YccC [Bradyrhizobium sp. USDA 372]